LSSSRAANRSASAASFFSPAARDSLRMKNPTAATAMINTISWNTSNRVLIRKTDTSETIKLPFAAYLTIGGG